MDNSGPQGQEFSYCVFFLCYTRLFCMLLIFWCRDPVKQTGHEQNLTYLSQNQREDITFPHHVDLILPLIFHSHLLALKTVEQHAFSQRDRQTKITDRPRCVSVSNGLIC